MWCPTVISAQGLLNKLPVCTAGGLSGEEATGMAGTQERPPKGGVTWAVPSGAGVGIAQGTRWLGVVLQTRHRATPASARRKGMPSGPSLLPPSLGSLAQLEFLKRKRGFWEGPPVFWLPKRSPLLRSPTNTPCLPRNILFSPRPGPSSSATGSIVLATKTLITSCGRVQPSCSPNRCPPLRPATQAHS